MKKLEEYKHAILEMWAVADAGIDVYDEVQEAVYGEQNHEAITRLGDVICALRDALSECKKEFE